MNRRRPLLVSYDLSKPGRDYSGLHDVLKGCDGWWHYLDSTWIVITTNTPDELSEKLRKHLDGNDSLLVIEIKQGFGNRQGWLAEDAWKWFRDNVDKLP